MSAPDPVPDPTHRHTLGMLGQRRSSEGEAFDATVLKYLIGNHCDTRPARACHLPQGPFRLRRGSRRAVDICGRTQEVQDAILAEIGSETCSTVTHTQLASITSLSITGYSATSLASADFAGLTTLTALYTTPHLENGSP